MRIEFVVFTGGVFLAQLRSADGHAEQFTSDSRADIVEHCTQLIYEGNNTYDAIDEQVGRLLVLVGNCIARTAINDLIAEGLITVREGRRLYRSPALRPANFVEV